MKGSTFGPEKGSRKWSFPDPQKPQFLSDLHYEWWNHGPKTGPVFGSKSGPFSDLILDPDFYYWTFIIEPGPPAARAGWTKQWRKINFFGQRPQAIFNI